MDLKWDRIAKIKRRNNVGKLKQNPGEIISPIVRSIIENHAEAACLFDYKGDMQHLNAKFLKMLGFAQSEKEFVDAVLAQLFRYFEFDRAMSGHPQFYEDVIIDKDGQCVPITITHIPVVVSREVLGSLCTIEPRKDRSQPKLGQIVSEIRFQDILNRLDVAVWSVDLIEKKVLFVSDAIQEIYGIPAAEVHFDTWRQLIHRDDLRQVEENQSQLLEKGKIIHTYRIITSYGTLKWVKDHSIALKNADGQIALIVGSLEDITQSKQLQNKLQNMAFIDHLTQLPNSNYARKLLQEWIDTHEHNGKTFAMLRLNMDGFNRVNDVFGPSVGDEVIKRMAKRITASVADGGIFFRMAGDEFLILAHHQKETDGYEAIAANVLNAIHASLPLNSYDFHLTASVGISVYPFDGKNGTLLVKNGRAALKRAKQLGKSTYQVYSQSMDIESFKFFQLENDLRKAIKTHELYFDFQPKVDAKSQKAIAAEALIRWNHPTWGVVSPTEFIEIAEEGALIHKISDIVIETVCRQVKMWMKKGVPFERISFNLSGKDFLRRDLSGRVKRYLDRYEVPAERLEIEITEGVMLQQDEIVREQMQDLKNLGVAITIDDYGVGYSSVSHFRNYPIDVMKIDRSFIQAIVENEEDRFIVQSLIELGKGLKKTVIAEGVENREQYDLLKNMGCTIIQGFLFSPPVSAEDMEALFLADRLQPKQTTFKPKVERRKYFRYQLPMPLCVNMTIIALNKKSVSLGSTEVLVENISLGGLRFMSQLRLTTQADILYSFKVQMMDTLIKLAGKIVWSYEKQKDIFQYGVEFIIQEQERDALSSLLNKLRGRLKSNSVLKDGPFVTENPILYLQKQ
ncbi:MAG TPA: EAL domain-containing protein [Bacillales bacterium]|nr:EAL domain-containing protein [Bacillales bacterium]